MSSYDQIANCLYEHEENQSFLYHQTLSDLIKCQQEGQVNGGHHVPLYRYNYGGKINARSINEQKSCTKKTRLIICISRQNMAMSSDSRCWYHDR